MKKNWLRLLCLLMIGCVLISGALADSIEISEVIPEQAEIVDTELSLDGVAGDDIPALDDALGLDLDESLDLEVAPEPEAPAAQETAGEAIEADTPVAQVASNAVESNATPVEYFVVEDGVVTGYTGNDGNKTVAITVPASKDGVTITGIGDDVFNGYACLESIELPDTLTRIGDNAFNGCAVLKNIKLPARRTHELTDHQIYYKSITKRIFHP